MKTKFVHAISVTFLLLVVLSTLHYSGATKASERGVVAALQTADPKPGHTG
jgi:hypothetical protein